MAAVSPFNEYDVSAINGYQTAAARIREVVRQANVKIEADRGPLYHGESRAELDFWEHAPAGPGWPETAYFELHGRRDSARTEPVGDWVLGAGVSWERRNAPLEFDLPDWFERRWEEGFEYGASSSRWQHLFRYLSLGHLAEIPTLPGQAAHLATWALETWTLLDGGPAPDAAMNGSVDYAVLRSLSQPDWNDRRYVR